jgi:hypothetical protein
MWDGLAGILEDRWRRQAFGHIYRGGMGTQWMRSRVVLGGHLEELMFVIEAHLRKNMAP